MDIEDELVVRQLAKLEAQLRDMEAAWGYNHPKLIDKLQALADLHFVLNRYSDAEPLYWRLVEIKFRHLGERHPDTLLGIIDLADIFRALEKNEEASKYYSLAIRTLIDIANESGGMTPLLQKASNKLLELRTSKPQNPKSAQTVPVAC